MEEQKRNKYLLGIIGATIGAFIGVIPWILVYIYGNMIVALLSILVAVGSYQGYRITKATIDKKLPVIVAITSVLAITVATFIIIPLGLLAKEELGATFENLEFIYGESEFKRAIIGDYVISLLFTVLGIGGIISNLHKQIKEGATREELKLNLSNPQQVIQPEEIELAKEVFVKYNALDKNNTIAKQEFIEDINAKMPENRANEVFNILKVQGIIKKSKGKYYFSEKAQNRKLSRAGKNLIIIFSIIFIIIILMVIIASTNNNKSTKSKDSTSKNSVSNTTSKYEKEDEEDKDDEEDVQYEKEHFIDIANMNFIPKDDLLILTDEEIKTYYGAEYTSYEIIAMDMNGTRILYCFIDDDESVKDLSSEEFLKETLTSSESNEIKTVNISGFEFATTTLSFEQGGKKYLEDCYVYKVGDKFVCFDYCYLEGKNSSFDKMIEKK